MNQRLDTAYNDIAVKDREGFLANDLALDTQWNAPIWGITLQIDLGDAVKDAVEGFQRDIREIEGDNVLCLPRAYQHISFNQVVFWDGVYVAGKEATWDAIKDDFTEKFRALDNTLDSFEITFSRLVATKAAIIWCGYDAHDELEELRNLFLKRLPFPAETTKFNHIIHTTVVRYHHPLAAPHRVMDYIQSQHQTAAMRVIKIALKNEIVFPSIYTEDIAEIRLR